MHRDITEFHRLEQMVRNQKALIESVVDAAPIAIALLDQKGRVLLDNQAYKKLVTDLRVAEPAHTLLDGVLGTWRTQPTTSPPASSRTAKPGWTTATAGPAGCR
jgi:hypothetical protein